MSENTLHYQSYHYLYTRIWLVSSAVIIVLRFLGTTQDQRGYVLMTYMGISGLTLLGLNLFEGQRLAQYLNKYRPELVKRGRYGFGLSGLDGWRLLGLTKAIKQSNDATALWLLENYRDFVVLLVLIVISYPILFAITILWP
jgi:hypothetical protein